MMLLILDLPEPLFPISKTFLFLVFLISAAGPANDEEEAAISAAEG